MSNRKQRVQVNGEFSQWHDVTSGIPQGSVLGPILFVVFINDLPDCVDSEVFMFADDTKLYRDIADQNDIQTVQDDINKLFNWSEKWLLRFHPDKCKVLPITTKYNSNREDGRYKMPTYEGSVITLVTVNCDQHIQAKVNKANQIVGLIRRSFRYLDFKTFCLLFKALVRPHLEYAECTWNPFLKKDIESIENVQRRATKMLPNLKDLTYEERLKRLKLPTLRFRRLRGDMIETYKVLSKIYDDRVTSTLFSLNCSNRTRGHAMKLVKKRCRTEIRTFSQIELLMCGIASRIPL